MNLPWWYVMTDLSTTPYNTFKSLAACSRANFSFCFSRNILQADFNRFSFNSAVTSSILLMTSPKKCKKNKEIKIYQKLVNLLQSIILSAHLMISQNPNSEFSPTYGPIKMIIVCFVEKHIKNQRTRFFSNFLKIREN